MPVAMVVGSSGYVGSRLIARLLAERFDVVATARDPDKLLRFDFAGRVSRVALDVGDAASCAGAFADAPRVDVAYYLVHSIGGDDFAERDLAAARCFIAAARAAGVRRVVYLGGFVPDDAQLSEHLESRAEVGEALDQTGTELVWLRAAVILGAGSTSYELIRYLAERLPVVPMPTWIRRPVAPIAVDDVLNYLLACADGDTVPAGRYDISNGEDLTYADLIKYYARSRGLRRRWVKIAGVSPRAAAPLVARLTPIPRDLVADLVESLANTMSSDDSRIRRLVPDPPGGLTTLEAAISRADIPVDFLARGVCATTDPLQLCDTDAGWAGGDQHAAAGRV